MNRNAFPAQEAEERRDADLREQERGERSETLEQIALRVANDMLLQHTYDQADYAEFSKIFARRLVAELDKQAEPVAWCDKARSELWWADGFPKGLPVGRHLLYLRPASTAEIEARVPDGMVLVPEAPTERMIICGTDAGPELFGPDWARRVYKAMIAAAKRDGE